ncbi:MAG: sugar-binding protein, partial [Verrucomicrobiales bacterium]
AWATANEYEDFENAGGAEVEGPEDASAKWKALWDEDNLYFFIEVKDDTRFTDTDQWTDDSVELYLDTESLGKGDDPVADYRPEGDQFGPLLEEIPEDPAERPFPIYQLTIIAGQDQIYNGVNHRTWVNSHPVAELDADNKALHQGVSVDSGDGYTLEIALPWESLGAATPTDILDRGSFGFGIAINDNDVGGTRETQLMWATGLGDLWNNPTQFPDVALLFPEGPGPDVFVKKSLDLGQLSAAEPSISQVLTVSNVGVENALTITKVSASGADGGLVTIDESPTTIAPGAVGEINYTLTPGRTGAFNFNIDIESDDVDADDKLKTVALTASVINFAGPAVHYTMDGDAGATELIDVTGYNRHGTLDGATLGGAGLATGESMSVSGGSQGVIPPGTLSPNSFSISMWVQPSELAGAQTLISHGVGNPTFAILAQEGDLNWFAGGAPEFGATGAIAAGTTYHVVATYSSDQAVLYIDGASVGGQGNPAEVSLDGTDSFFIGAFDGGLPFAGLIDDVQIYDRVISEEDVAFLFGNPGDVLGAIPAGDLPAGAIAGGPELKGADGLAAYYWNTEPKSTPAVLAAGDPENSDNPLHRAEGPGLSAGYADENVYNTPATGSFTATTFNYGGNDLTPIAEWLGDDFGSFSGTESDLDEGVFRMVGYVYVEVPGDRTFTTTSDDGSVLYINDELVIDNDSGHGNVTVSADVNFPAQGYYPVDLRYFNGDWTSAAGDHGGANFIGDAGFT